MLNTGRVIFNKRINDEIRHLRIAVSPRFSAMPGQFINIRVSDGYSPLLRRPFSVFDHKKGMVDVVYRIIGEGTKKLSEKIKGDKIDFIGPAGNSYIDFLPDTDVPVCLVAGGTGFASIHFFAKWLDERKIKFRLFYGARNKKELIPDNFRNSGVFIFTDDGSYGKKGLVTDFLKKGKIKNSVIFCCGPKAMIKAVSKIKAVKKFASFESYMGCAIGVCLSCVVKIKKDRDFDYLRACQDGTVFDLDKVIF
ncbi:MAG TPA: dihydroorotate dehydrogenase electron transfer subunit [Candidatus Goldiibacteriota bacterium]|nr:dihydroorotate dehydrogenase electron transfer subunit [Candidatus Goldiibacteriota bacterium]